MAQQDVLKIELENHRKSQVCDYKVEMKRKGTRKATEGRHGVINKSAAFKLNLDAKRNAV